MEKRISNGFTLIECLLAIAIFSILMISVYSVFRAGVMAERKGEDVTEELRRIRWVINDLSQEIRNAITQPSGYFEGESGRLTFLAQLPYDDDRLPDASRLYRVSYRLGTDGMTGLTTLVKIVLEPIENKADTVIIQGMFSELQFFYEKIDGEEKTWLASWGDQEGVPSAIRVEIVISDDSDDGESGVVTHLIPIMSDREIGSGGGG